MRTQNITQLEGTVMSRYEKEVPKEQLVKQFDNLALMYHDIDNMECKKIALSWKDLILLWPTPVIFSPEVIDKLLEAYQDEYIDREDERAWHRAAMAAALLISQIAPFYI